MLLPDYHTPEWLHTFSCFARNTSTPKVQVHEQIPKLAVLPRSRQLWFRAHQSFAWLRIIFANTSIGQVLWSAPPPIPCWPWPLEIRFRREWWCWSRLLRCVLGGVWRHHAHWTSSLAAVSRRTWFVKALLDGPRRCCAKRSLIGILLRLYCGSRGWMLACRWCWLRAWAWTWMSCNVEPDR